MHKPLSVLGLLGTQLDQAHRKGRWSRWRPTVAICQQDDLVVDRFDLLFERRSERLFAQIAEDLRSVSPETHVESHPVSFQDPWDFEEVYSVLHDFCREYSFDTENYDYLTHITTGTHVAQICLFLLTESRHLPAKLLQTSPMLSGEKSPKGEYRIIDLDLSKYDHLAARFLEEQREAASILKSGIETRDLKFNALIDRIEQVSLATTAPILLTGPTGAGKSQLAKRIYELKRAREQITGDCVEVNCATLRGDQAMSSLFGHTKGAFTGAGTSRTGLLMAADGGLLFLDEVGELGADEQAMLLHAIEEKSFLPVGSDQQVQSDFQLIAGTNRDLLHQVAKGEFREDLLARINLWTFQLPGLKQRSDDIAPNLEFELQRFARTTGRNVTFNREAREKYLRFALSDAAIWKANFRDLNASVTRLATLAPAARIDVASVEEEIQRLKSSWQAATAAANTEIVVLNSVLDAETIQSIDLFERSQLASVIQVCKESPTLAAAGRRLFQVSRKTKASVNDSDRLRKYLAKFELHWNDLKG